MGIAVARLRSKGMLIMANLGRPLELPLTSFLLGSGDTAVDLALRAVGELTARLFAVGYRIEQAQDHEIPGEAYFVFHVSAEGTVDEIVAKHDEWHRGLRRIDRERRGIFRLSIDAQPAAGIDAQRAAGIDAQN